jgi:hypothetical protein
MASTRRDKKWEKYFEGKGDVSTFVRATGSVVDRSYLYDLEGKKTAIKLEHGEVILVKERQNYIYDGPYANKLFVESARGNGWLHIDNIDKGRGGKPSVRLESNKFIGLGENIIVPSLNDQDNVPCKAFRTADQLAKSIMDGLYKEASVPDYIFDQVQQLFYDDVIETPNQLISGNVKFKWNGSVSDTERNDMGVYLGELLIGYMLLSGNKGAFSEPKILEYPIEYFAVPTDPAFSGVDSFIQYKNESDDPNKGKYLISSKAGNKGASPSIWSNIMPKLNPNKVTAENCPTLKKLYDICRAIDGGKITGRNSMKYVYRYGVEEILEYEIGPTTADRKGKQGPIINPYHFYRALVAGLPFPPVYNNVILKAIEIQKNLNSTNFKQASSTSVTTALANNVGMSSFFSKYISDMLNNEEESLKRMRNCITGRKIYQAYLNTSKFKTGEIFFSTKKVTTANLITTGSKSGATQIDISNTLNYDLIFGN